MKQLGFLGLLVNAALIFTSCEEEESKPGKKELLTGKNWSLTSWTVNPGVPTEDGAVTNVFAILRACDKDDFTRFDKNGSVTFDEGDSKCSVDSDQTMQGTWSFNSDETVVSVTSQGEAISYRILDLTNSSVKIEYDEFEDGVKYTSTKAFKAK
jgi:hypothetical protein